MFMYKIQRKRKLPVSLPYENRNNDSNELEQKILKLKIEWLKGKGLGINEQRVINTRYIDDLQKNYRTCVGSKTQESSMILKHRDEGVPSRLNWTIYEDSQQADNYKINEKDPISGLCTINRGSSKDYFAKKMRERSSKLNSIDTSHNIRDSFESEKEQRVGFELCEDKKNILSHNFSEKNNYASENSLVLTISSSSSSDILKTDFDSDSDHQSPKKKKLKNNSYLNKDINNNII